MESDSEPDILQDVTPPQASVKLPSGQSLTASQVFDAITNESHSIVDSIPNGFKDKLFFLFDSSENIHRRQNSQHSTFADDCGSWDTHSGRTTKEHFIIMPNNQLKWTMKKDGIFHFQTKKTGRRHTLRITHNQRMLLHFVATTLP